jgi:hypothetical protein
MAELTEGLLPCPFCGGSALEFRPITRVRCKTCGAEAWGEGREGAFRTQDEAIADWNRRAPISPEREEAHRLLDAYIKAQDPAGASRSMGAGAIRPHCEPSET